MSAAARHVVVVGDVMLDRYWFGETARISPEAPVPVVNVARERDFPGGAGNVARNVVSLGAPCVLIGVVGADAHGASVAAALAQEGVDARLERLEGWATITKLRVVSRMQQLVRADFETAVPAAAWPALVARFEAALDGAAAVVLSDYDKGTLLQPGELVRLARDRGVPVLVDPKHRPFSDYAGASLLKPNWPEFLRAAGLADEPEDLAPAARRLLEAVRVDALVITRGDRGIWYQTADGTPVTLPAHRVEVFDVSGAGDTTMAALAVGTARGRDLAGAVRYANAAGALAVSHAGTARITDAQVAALLGTAAAEDADPLPAGGGVVAPKALDALAARLRAAQDRGERIVFTNGCFDLIHAGHVRYLARAAALGDQLVVAVNDDASVRRHKGPSRPVEPLEHRMEVLAALGAVTWVVPFADDTPEALLERLRPDVLVKGGDYTLDQVVGAPIVRAYGGEVAVLEEVPGRSTTGIVERIRGGSGTPTA
jgi:D-beta-D-heptose 7-phosphate kinase/D-beta-D-heptose 1-phosphate adenosyltransferase